MNLRSIPARLPPVSVKRILFFTVVSLIVLSPVAYGAKAPSPRFTFSIQNLSNDSGASTAPVVATVNYGGHQYVYVAWEDKTPGKTTTFFRVSVDGGIFKTPTEFTGLGGSANAQDSAVQIAAEGQYVFLTWEQDDQSAYAISSNNGATFSSNLFSVTGALSGTMTGEAISACGRYAYFTWADFETSGLNKPILYVVAHDKGGGDFTFTSPTAVSSTASAHGEDESACVGDYVYIVWDSIYFTASSNHGKSFSTPQQLHSPYCSFPCLAREPMISANGTNVYVTFPSDNTTTLGVTGPYNTYIVVSHDNGATFPKGPQLLSKGFSNTREVQVASYGSNVYVTSRGTKSGVAGTQQYIYVSTDSAGTFSAGIPLASSPQSGPENGFGGFALDQTTGNVYVQWLHGIISQLYISESTNSGASWSGGQQVSQSTGGVIAMGDPHGGQGPVAAADNGKVYIVWEDTSTGNGDIYFTSAPSM